MQLKLVWSLWWFRSSFRHYALAISTWIPCPPRGILCREASCGSALQPAVCCFWPWLCHSNASPVWKSTIFAPTWPKYRGDGGWCSKSPTLSRQSEASSYARNPSTFLRRTSPRYPTYAHIHTHTHAQYRSHTRAWDTSHTCNTWCLAHQCLHVARHWGIPQHLTLNTSVTPAAPYNHNTHPCVPLEYTCTCIWLHIKIISRLGHQIWCCRPKGYTRCRIQAHNRPMRTFRIHEYMNMFVSTWICLSCPKTQSFGASEAVLPPRHRTCAVLPGEGTAAHRRNAYRKAAVSNLNEPIQSLDQLCFQAVQVPMCVCERERECAYVCALPYFALTPAHSQIYFQNWYAFSMLKLTKFPPPYGGGVHVLLHKPCHEQVHSAHSSCMAPERVRKQSEFGWK